jgi:hypothetical protein
VTDLATLPALGERDVCPDGDPAGMASLVLQAGESGYALHASGPDLRRALRLRLRRRDTYRRVVEADTRPTSYVVAGLGLRYPLASTRADLDVVARAGARLWDVLGLTRDDVLVSGVPVAASAEHSALQLAALAAGSPALFPGSDGDAITAANRLTPPTVLALPAATAATTLPALGGLSRLHTVLLVGAPSETERRAAVEAAGRTAAPAGLVVLAVHAPSGARLLWAECRESGGTTGLHTYPDLDVVQVVDPETGESAEGAGELVLTQLGMRGSALLRWRTADVVDGVSEAACPACRRRVSRVEGVRRGALVARQDPPPQGADQQRQLDLRALAGALSALPPAVDWRVVVGTRGRDQEGQVVLHLVAGDDSQLVVDVATGVRDVAGTMPTQIVVSTPAALASLDGDRLSSRLLRRG